LIGEAGDENRSGGRAGHDEKGQKEGAEAGHGGR
jgi:hypothetical protein